MWHGIAYPVPLQLFHWANQALLPSANNQWLKILAQPGKCSISQSFSQESAVEHQT
jgi:hypothetical protein